jgi:hypothetical protein
VVASWAADFHGEDSLILVEFNFVETLTDSVDHGLNVSHVDMRKIVSVHDHNRAERTRSETHHRLEREFAIRGCISARLDT